MIGCIAGLGNGHQCCCRCGRCLALTQPIPNLSLSGIDSGLNYKYILYLFVWANLTAPGGFCPGSRPEVHSQTPRTSMRSIETNEGWTQSMIGSVTIFDAFWRHSVCSLVELSTSLASSSESSARRAEVAAPRRKN